jgi:ribosomal protein L11 methyltransferase
MLRELLLVVDEDHAEPLSDALLAEGALAVSVEDAEADSPAEQALFGEPGSEPARLAWRRSRLRVLVDGGSEQVASLIAQACDTLALPLPAWDDQPVPEQDWVRQTQAQFTPIQVAPALWIVPTWHTPPDAQALNLRIDPGAAFGTGTHPTTQLCLRWLAAHPPRGARVLDYGCGSGILAIAAALLGAAQVIGTDIDPQALVTARANASLNEVPVQYTGPQDLPSGRFDLVLANILANPLKVLAPALLARVDAGGALVLAGLLERQADELIDLYAQFDPHLPLTVFATADGWSCLAGRRV